MNAVTNLSVKSVSATTGQHAMPLLSNTGFSGWSAALPARRAHNAELVPSWAIEYANAESRAHVAFSPLESGAVLSGCRVHLAGPIRWVRLYQEIVLPPLPADSRLRLRIAGAYARSNTGTPILEWVALLHRNQLGSRVFARRIVARPTVGGSSGTIDAEVTLAELDTGKPMLLALHIGGGGGDFNLQSVTLDLITSKAMAPMRAVQAAAPQSVGASAPKPAAALAPKAALIAAAPASKPAGAAASATPAAIPPALVDLIKSERLFDARWYARKYQLTFKSDEEALAEYLEVGVRQDRNPNALFSSSHYRRIHMTDPAQEAGMAPFLHYLAHGRDQGLSPHPLVDPSWVVRQLKTHCLEVSVLSALLHRCAALSLDPHPCFSVRFYLARYPELLARRAHPVIHYLDYGAQEQRTPHVLFWPAWVKAQLPADVAAERLLVVYLENPKFFGLLPNPYFDPPHYTQQMSASEAASVNPLAHYLTTGWAAKLSPNPTLDAAWMEEEYAAPLRVLQSDPLSFLLERSNGHLKSAPGGTTLRPVKRIDAPQLAEEFRAAFGRPANPKGPHRILFLSHNFRLQGAQTSLFEIASGLKREGGYEVAVMAPDDGPIKERYEISNIPVHKLRLPTAGMTDEVQYAKLSRTLQTQITDLAPDVVHGNTCQTYHGLALAARSGIPTVWNIRESEPPMSHADAFHTGAKALYEEALNAVRRFVFVSRTTAELWQAMNPALPVTTINNGINYDNLVLSPSYIGREEARAALGIPRGKIVFFNVGTWSERKGQLDIVRAAGLIDRRFWHRLCFLLIGASHLPYTEEIRMELAALPAGLRDCFIIHDETRDVSERSKVVAAYRAADAFLFTSRIESYPRVVNEAMYFSLPIVATPCFGVVEQLRNGETALFYEAGDTGKLAYLCEMVAGDRDLRAAIGARAGHAARHGVMQYDDMLRRYGNVYSELLGA